MKAIASALALLLTGCLSAPIGALGDECSGVPGDFRTPATNAPTDPSDSTAEVVRLTARARPATSSVIPLLYVYDENADHVFRNTEPGEVLTAAIFEAMEREAYWGELVDDQFYRVPWLDKCSQASMVSIPLDFRAPRGGLLFVQFETQQCDECDAIATAIRDVTAAHPALPVRWIRIDVPRNVGRLRRD